MHELTNLLGLYCEAMDAGDFEAVGSLFAEGALCDEHGTVIASGQREVAAFYRDSVLLHDGSPRTKHLVLNHVVEPSPDGTTARIRSSYLVLQGLDGGLSPMICGRYEDRFARSGPQSTDWHFTERRFLVDLVGDLSRHLRFDV